MTGDVTVKDDVQHIVDASVGYFGRLDVLVSDDLLYHPADLVIVRLAVY